MKSIKNLRSYPVVFTLAADDVTEFHASRILLLILICGKKGQLDGLTKMAKLDFFVRYPEFLKRFTGHIAARLTDTPAPHQESAMIRYLYGPWDDRYYQLLSFLESRDLLRIEKASAKKFRFTLTETGQNIAETLKANPNFAELVKHMELVSDSLGGMSGNRLKELIYREFDLEVTARKMREMI